MKSVKIGLLIGVILTLSLFGFAVWLFFSAISIDSHSYLKEDDRKLLKILRDNANTPPIVNLALVELETGCPADYKATPYGYYYGVNDGVMCPAQDGFGCALTKTELNCKSSQIDKEDKDTLDVWGQNSLLLCIKTPPLGDPSYYHFPAGDKVGSCPGGYRACSLNLCVMNEGLCPIKGIALADEVTPPFEVDPYQKKRLESFSGNLHYVQYERMSLELPSRPVIALQTEVGENICVDPNEHPKRRNDYVCQLEGISRQGCSYYGADKDNSRMIDIQYETQTYTQNGIQLKPGEFNNLVASNLDLIRLMQRSMIPMYSINDCQKMELGFFEDYTRDVEHERIGLRDISYAIMSLCGIAAILLILSRRVLMYWDNIRKIVLLMLMLGIVLLVAGIILGAWYVSSYQRGNRLLGYADLILNHCNPQGLYVVPIQNLDWSIRLHTTKVTSLLSSTLIAAFLACLFSSFYLFGIYKLKQELNQMFFFGGPTKPDDILRTASVIEMSPIP
jgi:hypothetical protein